MYQLCARDHSHGRLRKEEEGAQGHLKFMSPVWSLSSLTLLGWQLGEFVEVADGDRFHVAALPPLSFPGVESPGSLFFSFPISVTAVVKAEALLPSSCPGTHFLACLPFLLVIFYSLDSLGFV